MDEQPVTSLTADPLTVAAVDTERHVAGAGWDQPARLFALVRTASLLAREPHLRTQLGPADLAEGAFTAIEQEGLPATSSLETLLGRIAWPDEVDGCAFAIERMVVPPDAERDLPERPEAVVEALAAHPDRRDVRLLVAVLRDGSSICLLRQREHDSTTRSPPGTDLAPGLVAALKATFEDLGPDAGVTLLEGRAKWATCHVRERPSAGTWLSGIRHEYGATGASPGRRGAAVSGCRVMVAASGIPGRRSAGPSTSRRPNVSDSDFGPPPKGPFGDGSEPGATRRAAPQRPNRTPSSRHSWLRAPCSSSLRRWPPSGPRCCGTSRSTSPESSRPSS